MWKGLASKSAFTMLTALPESFARRRRTAEATEYVYPDVEEIQIVRSVRSARIGGVKMAVTSTMIAHRTQLASMELGN